MKNPFIYLILFCLFYFMNSCQEESILIEETLKLENTNIQLEAFTASETPLFASKLNTLSTKSKIGWSSKSNDGGLVLDETRILVVTDSVGNKTFSARLYVPDTPYNVFYNVIAKLKANGEMNEPIVMRYIIAENYYATYMSIDRKNAPFKGKIDYYSIDTFTEGGTISGKNDFIVPPPNCPPIANDNSNTSSGSGGGGGSANGEGGGYTGTGGSHGLISITLPVRDLTPSIEVGEGKFGEYDTDGTWKRATRSKTGDCPNDKLLFPINEKEIVVFTPDKPIKDMADFLKCFDSSKSAKVTIYVAEPNPGSGDTNSGTNVGHTFVSINQGGSTATFGFYPATDDIYPILNPSDPSQMGEDGGDGFSASISRTVTGTQLSKILSYSKSFPKTYDLNSYNCSDFGIDVGNLTGFKLPDSYGTWPGGGGSNPGTLGKFIRGQTSNSTQTVNKNSGTSPVTKKGC